MMYLSRLILNPRSRQVRSELARPYAMHRTLLNAFPQGKVHVERTEEDAIGLLYRIDEDARSGALHVLVQSQKSPQWGFLAEREYLLPVADNPATRAVNLQLQPGQVLAFRLRANPTKRIKDTTKRIGLVQEEEQRAWLERKLATAGSALISVNIADEQIMHGKLFKEKEPEKRMNLLSVRFDGVLQVKDPTQLVKSIQAGFGSAKGLGFGLLSLARPQ